MKAIVDLDNNNTPIVRLVIDVGTKKGAAILNAVDKATLPILGVIRPVPAQPGVPDERVEVTGWQLVDIREDVEFGGNNSDTTKAPA